jgi:hypothetical protein
MCIQNGYSRELEKENLKHMIRRYRKKGMHNYASELEAKLRDRL